MMMLEGKGGPVGTGLCEIMGTEVRAACNEDKVGIWAGVGGFWKERLGLSQDPSLRSCGAVVVGKVLVESTCIPAGVCAPACVSSRLGPESTLVVAMCVCLCVSTIVH